MSLILLGILNSQAAAAGGAAAYDLLETQVLTSAAASVTFTGLGSYTDYKHLQLRSVARSTNADFTRSLKIRFNGVTSASYAYHYLRGTGSSVSSTAITSTTEIQLASIYANNAAANGFGVSICDILDFANTSKNTTIRDLGGNEQTNQPEIALTSGLFINTAAITSIELYTVSNLAANSRFSLYGIKGA